MKKNETNMSEYDVPFYGMAKSKGYTYNGACASLEKKKNVVPINGVRTESVWHWIGKGFLINIGGFFTTIFIIIMIYSWAQLLDAVLIMDAPFNILGFMILTIFIINTMRFPKIIGDWFYVK